VTENPALAIAALKEKALAVICWHPVQWQAIVSSGGALILSRTVRSGTRLPKVNPIRS
jgi:hypothetical protein